MSTKKTDKKVTNSCLVYYHKRWNTIILVEPLNKDKRLYVLAGQYGVTLGIKHSVENMLNNSAEYLLLGKL
jgi:hypothetical protein